MNAKELLKRVNDFYDGDASFGDPAMKILAGIDSASSLKKISPKTHNIAELLAHIVGWEDVYLKRFKGDEKATIDQNLSFDWKRIDKNEKSVWESLVTAFGNNRSELVSLLEDGRYDDRSKEMLVNNIMEHDIYHLAQISLLKPRD